MMSTLASYMKDGLLSSNNPLIDILLKEAAEKAKIEPIYKAAAAFVSSWNEFDGDPGCVGEDLAALVDAIDECLGDK